MPLALEQPGDGAEGHLVVGQPQLAPHLVARPGRVEKGVDVHAAVDRAVLLRPADPGGQRLLGHRVADADDRVAPPRRPALGGHVQAVLHRPLRRPERQAVDRVDDGRHALVPGRRPADDPRLRAVRVDHLGLKPPHRPAQEAIGPRRSPAGPRRTSSGISSTFKPWRHARSNRSPSGPSAGPVISVTSSPYRWCRPSTVSRVFSWAPPMIRRVMMWTILMNEPGVPRSARRQAERVEVFLHARGVVLARRGHGDDLVEATIDEEDP